MTLEEAEERIKRLENLVNILYMATCNDMNERVKQLVTAQAAQGEYRG